MTTAHWQPIETCPEDIEVLLFDPNTNVTSNEPRFVGRYAFMEEGTRVFSAHPDHEYFYYRPTAWAPLPEKPTEPAFLVRPPRTPGPPFPPIEYTYREEE